MIFKSRILILSAVLTFGLCSVFLLPNSFGIRQSAIVKALPSRLGSWVAYPQETPTTVRRTLGEETEHENAIYVRPAPSALGVEQYDRLNAFIVLSGSEMNASIHRPERCFPAQGLKITGRGPVSIPVEGFPDFEVMKLSAEGELPDGTTFKRNAFYWFVGHDEITNSHYRRTFVDIRDRVLKGYNQRWAYVMVSLDYEVENDGESKIRPLSEQAGDEMMREFITQLFPHIHRQEQLIGE